MCCPLNHLQAVPDVFVHTSDAFVFPSEPLPKFGLLDTSEGCWDRLQTKIAELNQKAPEGVSYKVH